MYEGWTTAYGIHTSEEINAYTDLCSMSNTKKNLIYYIQIIIINHEYLYIYLLLALMTSSGAWTNSTNTPTADLG